MTDPGLIVLIGLALVMIVTAVSTKLPRRVSLPAHIRQLGRPQVTISHEDHQRIVACDLSSRH